jgi:hypothetical protein
VDPEHLREYCRNPQAAARRAKLAKQDRMLRRYGNDPLLEPWEVACTRDKSLHEVSLLLKRGDLPCHETHDIKGRSRLVRKRSVRQSDMFAYEAKVAKSLKNI